MTPAACAGGGGEGEGGEAMSDIRYVMWRHELWSRNYGTTREIDADVERGKLIPGTMPRKYHKGKEDIWTVQPVIGGRGWPGWKRRLYGWRQSLACLIRGHVHDDSGDFWTPPDPCCQRCGKVLYGKDA